MHFSLQDHETQASNPHYKMINSSTTARKTPIHGPSAHPSNNYLTTDQHLAHMTVLNGYIQHTTQQPDLPITNGITEVFQGLYKHHKCHRF